MTDEGQKEGIATTESTGAEVAADEQGGGTLEDVQVEGSGDSGLETSSEVTLGGDGTEEVAVEKQRHPDLQWYVVNAYSGFELKVKKSLEERIRAQDMENFFGRVEVPQERVVELVRGQKKTSNRKFFPGYILVEMVLNEDTWHLVRETPKVSGFVGDARDPVPMSIEEVSRILEQVEEGAASPRARAKFEQGELVKVIDGPFADFNGTVEEVKPEKGKIRVLISIFGRATPVELDYIQVEKC